MIPKISQKRRSYLYVVLIAVVITSIILLMATIRDPGHHLHLRNAYAFIHGLVQSANPTLFWFFLTALPLLGFPATPLVIFAGLKLPTTLALLYVGSSLVVNLFLSYMIGRKFFRVVLSNLLTSAGHQIPVIPNDAQRQCIILVRLTPGLPVAVANYILVLGGVGLQNYMLISFPLQFTLAASLILFGRSIIEGSLKMVVAGVFLLFFVYFFRRALKDKAR